MFASLLLSLREGLEAALIIGILLGALKKIRRPELQPALWGGVVSAAGLSLAAAWALNRLGAEMSEKGEQIFEGAAMLLAAALLTWMLFWMARQASQLQTSLEAEVQAAAAHTSPWPLFLLAFLSVVREGVELALFLAAARFASGRPVWLGALLGLALAALLGWGLFRATLQLDLQKFFRVTGALLLLFAAGLVAHGVHEFNELGWIPPLIEHLWDTNHILDENSSVGALFKALFGYNGNPSLSEVLAYFGYFAAILAGLRWQKRRMPAALQA